MKKIGIMGGTFNPIHNAHLLIAECAMEEFQLNKIMFLTSGIPPHKINKNIIEPKLRHKMVQYAIDGNENFFANDYEVKKNDYSYTVETLKHLKKQYLNDDLYFIMGADSLNDFKKWYNPYEILQMCTLLVYPRYEIDIETKILEFKRTTAGDINLIHAPAFHISSSMIRKRVSENKSIRYFVPDKVREFIERENLYKNDER